MCILIFFYEAVYTICNHPTRNCENNYIKSLLVFRMVSEVYQTCCYFQSIRTNLEEITSWPVNAFSVFY